MFLKCQDKIDTPRGLKPLSLNGTFKNKGSVSYYYLWSFLGNDNAPADTCARCYVRLRIVNKHTLSASLMMGDSLLKTIEHKGKIKKHKTLFVQSSFKIDPKWILIWNWNFYRFKLYITDTSRLIVDDSKGGMLALIIMPLGAADNKSRGDFEWVGIKNPY